MIVVALRIKFIDSSSQSNKPESCKNRSSRILVVAQNSQNDIRKIFQREKDRAALEGKLSR